MQDKKYLATIVPLGPQARKQIQKGENLDVIRAAVWSETAKKLTPLLGSVCSRFLPATYAWSICNYRPFGVMLGGVTADMEDMLLCYRFELNWPLEKKAVQTYGTHNSTSTIILQHTESILRCPGHCLIKNHFEKSAQL